MRILRATERDCAIDARDLNPSIFVKEETNHNFSCREVRM